MPDTKTVTVAGIAVTVRRPTEAEATALVDKRNAFRDPNVPPPADYMDDGDEEVLACCVDPGPEVVEGLLTFAPLAMGALEAAVRDLGLDVPLEEDASLITPEIAAGYPSDKLVGVRLGERPPAKRLRKGETPPPDDRPFVILKRLKRIELKFIQREFAGRRVPGSRMAQLGKDHAVDAPADLWTTRPFLALDLAGFLLSIARTGGSGPKS